MKEMIELNCDITTLINCKQAMKKRNCKGKSQKSKGTWLPSHELGGEGPDPQYQSQPQLIQLFMPHFHFHMWALVYVELKRLQRNGNCV